jgi:hypothetical protein
MAYTYSKIATYTVGSGGVASISFLNIPQTYTDLMIVFSLRSSTAGEDTQLSFNSSTANFSSRNLAGNGSSASSGSRSDNIISASMDYSTYTASTFSNGSLYIPNYTSSNNKSFSVDTVVENNATTAPMQLIAGLWSNTAAITSITFTNYAAGNYVQYSSAHLYGIKAEL